MKILLLGKNGQVGWELQRSLAPLGKLVALDRHGCDPRLIPWPCEAQNINWVGGDLEQLEQLGETIEALRPDVVVNAAAYTAVDRAETESDHAHLINTRAPAAIARSCQRINALLIHYSTDYVFDGLSSSAYVEDDKTNPQSVYGLSKLGGETAVKALCERYFILRTGWVVGAHGHNFVKTILRLAQEKTALQVVNDQFGTPTSARFIADATAGVVGSAWAAHGVETPAGKVLQLPPFGIYHLSCAGRTSWHALAVYLLQTARLLGMPTALKAEEVVAIPAALYTALAPRPAMSVLGTFKIQKEFNIKPPMWEIEIAKVLLQLREASRAEKAQKL